jgi:hypothetical protein
VVKVNKQDGASKTNKAKSDSSLKRTSTRKRGQRNNPYISRKGKQITPK